MLVRRVRQGSVWFEATDALRGLDGYGTCGAPLSESSFSLNFAALLAREAGKSLLICSG